MRDQNRSPLLAGLLEDQAGSLRHRCRRAGLALEGAAQAAHHPLNPDAALAAQMQMGQKSAIG